MKYTKLILAITVLAAIAINSTAQQPNALQPDFNKPAVIPGYKLAWNDEFNSRGKPDSINWKYEYGFVRNEELQWYSDENAYCNNGLLVIEGRKEQRKNPYYDAAGKDWRVNINGCLGVLK